MRRIVELTEDQVETIQIALSGACQTGEVDSAEVTAVNNVLDGPFTVTDEMVDRGALAIRLSWIPPGWVREQAAKDWRDGQGVHPALVRDSRTALEAVLGGGQDG